MQIPAKAEYAVRALLTLASSEQSVSAEHLARQQDLPAKFLGAILSDLRRGGLVTSQRGPEGGFRLARDPGTIAIADVLRAVSGPMAATKDVVNQAIAVFRDQQISQAVKVAQDGDPSFNPTEWDVTLCWFLHKKGERPY